MNPDHQRPRPWTLLPLLLLTLWSPLVGALSSDKDQPIEIVADSVDINESTGTSTYTGNVEINQGSIRLRADRVLVRHRPGEPRKIDATGTPARFQQLPDNSKELVKGTAQRVEYRLDSEELVLSGQAELTQGKDRFSSDRIVYDRVKAVVKAGAAAQGKDRVRVTIQPGER
jgi:lipopolysaccharide export system protein LptA